MLMRRDSIGFTLSVLILLLCILAVIADVVHVDHVHVGRAYGSQHSTEISRRLAIGDDGYLYIAGTTTPRDEDEEPWGDTEAGDVTGKTDIFVAKVSAEGELQWVRRTGSKDNDSLGDMKIAYGAIYVCGSTDGDFGKPINGSGDAFVMKLTAEGNWAWRRPFQFGSEGEDACHGLAVDDAVFVAGSTSGLLFGDKSPQTAAVYPFVARLNEVEGDPTGVHIKRGRQRSTHGGGSADRIFVFEDDVYYLSTHWDPKSGTGNRVTSYLNTADPNAMLLRQLHMLKANGTEGFRATDMFVGNGSSNVFIVGIGTLDDTREGYYALKLRIGTWSRNSAIEWSTFLGYRSAEVPFNLQLPSIVVDALNSRVYIAGIEDGLFGESEISSEVVLTSFLVLHADTGVIIESWDRSVILAEGKQELLSIALDNDGDLFFTGIWDRKPGFYSKALIGSFGSPKFSSMSINMEPISEGKEVEDELRSSSLVPGGSSKAVGLALLFCLVAGVLLTCGYLCVEKRCQQLARSEYIAGDDLSIGAQTQRRACGASGFSVSSIKRSWHSDKNAALK